MKKSFSLFLLIIVLVYGCKESTIQPPDNTGNSDFYPASIGNYYFYNVSLYDSSGLIQSGIRKTYFVGDTIIVPTAYQIKVDTFQLSSQLINHSYFRKTSTGIFNYVDIDTNGFSSIVPDTLQGAISFDLEYRLLYQPLSLNQIWDVYKITINLLFTQFELFSLDAAVISKDSLTLSFQNSNVTKEVYKIEYKAKLVTDTTSSTTTYKVFAWIADGVGVIKWEGDSELINFFAGGNIYLPNTYVTEELFSYKIR
jgi:hypothetical protein